MQRLRYVFGIRHISFLTDKIAFGRPFAIFRCLRHESVGAFESILLVTWAREDISGLERYGRASAFLDRHLSISREPAMDSLDITMVWTLCGYQHGLYFIFFSVGVVPVDICLFTSTFVFSRRDDPQRGTPLP